MPETPPPPKGKGKGLGKRVGPLPLWVWLGAGAGLLLVGYLYLRGRSGGGGGPVELVTGAGAASPQERAFSGAPSSNGAPLSGLSPEVLEQLQGFGTQIGDIRGHVTELEDAFTASGARLNEDKTWSFPGGGDGTSIQDFADAVTASVITALGGTQPAPARGTPGPKATSGKKPRPGKQVPGKKRPPRGKRPRRKSTQTAYAEARRAVR